jgi:ubiquinone/menaquinone biosynthesis C-methylase UbiE
MLAAMATSRPAKLEHPVVAALYDAYVWPQELMGFRRQRQRMAGEARGRVLEVAAGTGLTFPFYTRAQEVIAIDPDPAMLKRARRRAANASCPVRLLQADAESLPFADAQFDTIVIAFGLCTIPHPETALREARRVLKPDGHLLFLEHVRSTGRRHARLQDLAAPAWRRLTGGCNPNRSSVETIEREFEIDQLWRKGIIVQGSAKAPASAPPSR